jgi:hypothetical protein
MQSMAYTITPLAFAGLMILANLSRAEESMPARSDTAQAQTPSTRHPQSGLETGRASRDGEVMTPCKRLLVICGTSENEMAAVAACDSYRARKCH